MGLIDSERNKLNNLVEFMRVRGQGRGYFTYNDRQNHIELMMIIPRMYIDVGCRRREL